MASEIQRKGKCGGLDKCFYLVNFYLFVIMKNKSILLADDHSIVRKGLRTIITDMLGFKDVEEVESCNMLMVALKKRPYTHLVLDMILPDGHCIEVLPNIKSLYPELIIAVFSQQEPNPYLALLGQYGIKKFIAKSSPETTIVSGLKEFLNEDKCEIYDGSIKQTPFDTLTHRELEVLHYLLIGNKPSDIKNKLNISPQSVHTYTQRIMAKTNTGNLVQLQQLANACGFS
ncbi:response regulator [Chitinophaga tropicalis]|uniref:Response regulator n=1 Tax=Chitinophaga tropicalis TaxID=2683588 RepID=A0A7K1U016_9BACT|nr:response regulator transcription factor [Chitinophaga tropicalis]MVT07709.1 response regulator [Chitinophaga tropicalis]